jgi:hypothetical protein
MTDRTELHQFAVVLRLYALALCVAVAGCSTSSLDSINPFSAPKNTTAAAEGAAQQDIGTDDLSCPDVTVRSGAGTLTIAGKASSNAEPAALDLRYQGTIVRTARDCKFSGGNVTMKVGIEGRVVLGPAGGPGQLDVPLRLAVVHEGPQPRTIVSKLVHIAVNIGPGEERVTFSHVDSDIVFPLPRPLGTIDSYIVYVGFDPNAAPAQKPKPAAPRRKR